MSKDNSNNFSGTDLSDQPTDGCIVQRRKRLAHLIGRLLAHKWLQRHRQAEKDRDSQDDSGA